MGEIIELLESVVEIAWQEEKLFSRKIFGKEAERTDSLCQGLSRNLYNRLFPIFPNCFMMEIKAKERTHIIVYISYNLTSYIIDGSIKQFLPEEERSVFIRKDYPFNKALQKGKRWLR